MDGIDHPIDRWRRVHIAADQRAPFGSVRTASPTKPPRYGGPGLVERVLAWVFG